MVWSASVLPFSFTLRLRSLLWPVGCCQPAYLLSCCVGIAHESSCLFHPPTSLSRSPGLLPGCFSFAGVEPDFILVSCSGSSRPGLDATDMARLVTAKRRGEDLLRSTGLGYTVIRPGPLVVSWGCLLCCAVVCVQQVSTEVVSCAMREGLREGLTTLVGTLRRHEGGVWVWPACNTEMLRKVLGNREARR